MKQAIIIQAGTAVPVGVRLRNRAVFVLSWLLWCALFFQVFGALGRHGAATIGQLHLHRMDAGTVIGIGVVVLAALLGWRGYQLARSKRIRQSARAAGTTSRADRAVVPLDVIARYFGVDAGQLPQMQRARHVVIEHHADGRVARMLSADLRRKNSSGAFESAHLTSTGPTLLRAQA